MKRPEYVAVVTAIYAAALREHREPTGQELAQLEAAFSRQGFTQGYFRDRKGPAMFGTRPEGTRDPDELFAQAKQFYTRGEHRPVPVTPHRPGAPGGTRHPHRPGRRRPHRHRPGGRPPARPHPAGDGGADRRPAGQDRGHGVRRPRPPGPLRPGALPPPVGGKRPAAGGAGRPGPGPHRAPRPGKPGPSPPPRPGRARGSPRPSPCPSGGGEQLSPDSLDQGPALVYLPVQEWASHEKEAAELHRAYPDIAFGAVFPRVAFDRERPQLRQALEAACRAGATQALLGHIGQLALAREFGLTPGGTSAWASPTPSPGRNWPGWGLPRPRPPSSAGCPRSGTWAKPCPPRPLSTAACP